MSNMTPFEIRLELLKMAKDMLSDDYYGKRESISNQYASQCEYAKLNGQPVPDHPGFPPFPNESEIVTKANALNGFVSQQIPNSSQEKTIKKST
jgi:hypothetical protein